MTKNTVSFHTYLYTVFMYFVYVLLCKNQSLYTGITTDPHRRFKEHKAGKGGAYTRSHTPIKIVYLEKAESKSAALRREMEIKNWKRKEKLLRLSISV